MINGADLKDGNVELTFLMDKVAGNNTPVPAPGPNPVDAATGQPSENVKGIKAAAAKADFAELYRLQPKAVNQIPDAYLQDIAPKAYEARQKQKAEARKKYAEQWKKEQREK